jgi:fructose-bisphosphate aldolase class II
MQFQEAISYGVVKVNLDTDLQWAYLIGVRDYVLGKKDYLATQVGNPLGEDKRMCIRLEFVGLSC